MEHIVAFTLYSLCGAVFEHASYNILPSDETKALTNPILTGFPLYGLGAYLIVLINSQLEKNNIESLPLKFIIFACILTLLEYLVGKYVGAGGTSIINGKIDAWDYSNDPYNYEGIITLRHFIIWGFLGIIISILHPHLIESIKYGTEYIKKEYL